MQSRRMVVQNQNVFHKRRLEISPSNASVREPDPELQEQSSRQFLKTKTSGIEPAPTSTETKVHASCNLAKYPVLSNSRPWKTGVGGKVYMTDRTCDECERLRDAYEQAIQSQRIIEGHSAIGDRA